MHRKGSELSSEKEGIFLKIKNSAFCRMFLLFLLAMSIPTAALGIVSINHSTNNIVDQISQSNSDITRDKMNMIENKIVNTDKIVTQIASTDDLWIIVRSNYQSTQNQFKMVELIKLLNKTALNNQLIESIYIFDEEVNFVLNGSTKYSKDDFPDREILNTEINDTTSILFREYENKEIVSYIRIVGDILSSKRVYIVVNMERRNSLITWFLTFNNSNRRCFCLMLIIPFTLFMERWMIRLSAVLLRAPDRAI